MLTRPNELGAAAGRLAQHLNFDVEKQEPILDERYFIFAKVWEWNLAARTEKDVESFETHGVQAMYAIELTQLLSIGPTKLSVLLFYLRLFGRPSRTFTIINMSLITVTLMWMISFFFANMFKCSPIYAELVPNPPGSSTCIDESKMFLAQAYSDIILDVLILALPIPISMYPDWSKLVFHLFRDIDVIPVYRMQLRWGKKIGVFIMFFLGAL